MVASPTARTLEVLKDWGYYADRVERYMLSWKADPMKYMPRILERYEGAVIDRVVMDQILAQVLQAKKDSFGTRKDWGGFGDVLSAGDGITLIQCCVSGGLKNHIDKICGEDCWEWLDAWLNNGGRVEVWGWRKIKPPPGSRRTWWGRVVVIYKNEGGEVCAKDVGDYAVGTIQRPGKVGV